MKDFIYYYRLIISYKGSFYYGWQDIGANDIKPTIEASIHQVLRKICKYQKCTISVASRTDAGVHAQGQVAKIAITLPIASHKLLLGMNSLLSDDIRILSCEDSSKEFNPNRQSKAKEYHYYFSTDIINNPVLHDIVTNIGSSLDIKQMQEASKLFIGEHDFYSFAKRDNTMPSTVRKIISCEIEYVKDFPFANDVYVLKVVGKGFLRYMVRYIAGALFALGKNKIALNSIKEALENQKEEKLTPKAKAKGLHLMKVFY